MVRRGAWVGGAVDAEAVEEGPKNVLSPVLVAKPAKRSHRRGKAVPGVGFNEAKGRHGLRAKNPAKVKKKRNTIFTTYQKSIK